MKKSDKTRRVILETAATVFLQKGYAAATLKQIAAGARMKEGSLYYYFDSKEELAEQALEIGIKQVFAALKERLDALPPEVPYVERFELAVRTHLEKMLEGGAFTAANIRVYSQLPVAAQRRQVRLRKAYGACWQDLLQAGQREGVIREDVDLSLIRMLLLGALNWSLEWFDVRKKPAHLIAREAATMVLRGIGTRAAPGVERAIAPTAANRIRKPQS